MKTLADYKFKRIYELVDLVQGSAEAGIELWNFDVDYFIKASTKFSKDTLLHLYIVVTAMNYYHRDFRKNGDLEDDETLESWYVKFEAYQIPIQKFGKSKKKEVFDWFEENEQNFQLLYERMAEEVFYILFGNRQFLLSFNIVIKDTVVSTQYPVGSITSKGTIKRVSIPKWVQSAVFHRDKGRCVFCFTDLTSLVNTLTSSNYDHIIPLDLFGTNDPCNIQLTCETCNKSKKNKEGKTSSRYIPWW